MRRLLFFALTLISLQAIAEEWEIGKGLVIYPVDGLDVTFQIVEDYDAEEKIVVGWKGEALSFLFFSDRQPGGKGSDEYWGSLLSEIKRTSDDKAVNVEATFRTDSGIEFKKVVYISGGANSVQLIGLAIGRRSAYYLLGSSSDGDFDYMKDVVLTLSNTAKFIE